MLERVQDIFLFIVFCTQKTAEPKQRNSRLQTGEENTLYCCHMATIKRWIKTFIINFKQTAWVPNINETKI